MNKKQEELLKRIIEINEELELRKKLYEEYDKVVEELRKTGFKNAEFQDLIFELVDNFEEKNTAWRMAAIKRFELKIKKPKNKAS